MAISGIGFSGIFCFDGQGVSGQDTLHATRPIAGTITKDVQTEDILGHVDGSCIAQVLSTIITQTTFTMSLETRDIDSGTLELLLDERWMNTASYVVPYINTGVANASGVVLDAKVTGTLNPTTCKVSLVSSITDSLMRPLQVITTGTPTAEQALVANGQITLATANAGMAVKYSVDVANTNIDTIGVEANGKFLTNMGFAAKLCTTSNEDIWMYIRNMTKSGGFTFDLKGQNNATLEYRLNTLPGKRLPIEFARDVAVA